MNTALTPILRSRRIHSGVRDHTKQRKCFPIGRQVVESPVVAPLIRIGLVFDYSLDYCRTVVHGIKRYAEVKPRWTFLSLAPDARELGLLHKLRPHGLIAHVFSAPLARALTALRKPLVNVSSVVELPLPRVATDDGLIGRLA